MERYHVRVCDDSLVFSAAHFITFGGNECEGLHGHNFQVAAEVHGSLDENHYVVDFIALRKTLRALLAQLDHRVLLPTCHLAVRVEATDREVEVRHADRRWVFPRADCALLPVANVTAELLAGHLARGLLADLQQQGVSPQVVRVEVEESAGQAAVCELRGP